MQALDLNDGRMRSICMVLNARLRRTPGCRPDKDRLADDMEFFDFGTIFFLVAAVVIFFQLRNVLGRRTGNERPPFDPYTAGRARDEGCRRPRPDNVVSLPRKRAPAKRRQPMRRSMPSPSPARDLNKGLRAIKDADPTFEPKGSSTAPRWPTR